MLRITHRYEDCGCMPKNVIVDDDEPTNEFLATLSGTLVTETEKNCGRRGPELSDMKTVMAADEEESNITVARKMTL